MKVTPVRTTITVRADLHEIDARYASAFGRAEIRVHVVDAQFSWSDGVWKVDRLQAFGNRIKKDGGDYSEGVERYVQRDWRTGEWEASWAADVVAALTPTHTPAEAS